jgi:hypothetical protein
MKRIQLIAAALCLVMIATVGTGVVAAKQGESSNYKFDVTYNDMVVGHLVVKKANAKDPIYSLDVHGLAPNKKYTFGYTDSSGVDYARGNLITDAKGAIKMQGPVPADVAVNDLQSAQFWLKDPLPGDAIHTAIYGFYLDNLGSFICKIACYYSTDGGATWKESDHSSKVSRSKWVSLKDLGVPDIALVKIHVIVVAGKDRTGETVFKYNYATGVQSHGYEAYYITGFTWNPVLTPNGSVIIW